MKKLSCILLTLVLLTALALPVQAASGSVSLSASSTSLHRGDSFTISVYLNNTEPIALGTVALSYDTSVFEMTGGSCHVSGAAVGQVIAAQRVGTFMLSGEPQVISGKIFTFDMRIKEDAAFGSYTISSSASVGVNVGEAISSGSVSITVACDHSYGGWTKADENNHQKTCSICKDVQTEPHKWDAGTETKPATCKETGVMSYSCSDCGATKTEDIPKTEDHKFGNLTAVDDKIHKATCTVCEKEVKQDHTWDAGKETKPATCKEDGEKTYTCTGCKHIKTEVIPKNENHKFGNLTAVDENNHKDTCSVCKKEITQPHSWNTGAVTKKATCKEEGIKTYTCTGCGHTKTETLPKTEDHTWGSWAKADDGNHKRSCSVCQKEETGTHSYSTAWGYDTAEHWHECSVCKDRKDLEKHTAGPEATETTAQTCTVCRAVIKPALGHTHDFAGTWTTDEAGHWYNCSGCQDKGSYAEHDFEDACDKDCSICGFTRETTHSYGEAWQCDEVNHWVVCAGCGEIADETAHVPGKEATTTTAQTCTVCGYELVPALVEDAPAEETEAASQALLQPAAEKPGFPWWILIVAAVLAGGTAVIVVLKKKKK